MSGASRNCAAAVASGRGLNVSFAPKANKLLHGSETTRCATFGLMQCSKAKPLPVLDVQKFHAPIPASACPASTGGGGHPFLGTFHNPWRRIVEVESRRGSLATVMSPQII
jgi:hypothetical protein